MALRAGKPWPMLLFNYLVTCLKMTLRCFKACYHAAVMRRLSRHQLTVLTRQLAVLITAGLPITLALSTIAAAATERHLAKILDTVKKQIGAGYSLASALGQEAKLFSVHYCAVIAAGEKSGSLAQSLNYLAAYLGQLEKRQRKLVNLLLYPGIMLLVAVIIMIILISQVMPQLLALYAHLHLELPLLTRILLLIYAKKASAGYFAVLLIIFMLGLLRLWPRQHDVRAKWQLWLIKIPVLKKIFIAINLTRYLRTLAMLSMAGIPLIDSMQAAVATVTIIPMQRALEQARCQVLAGIALYCAYARTKYFAPLLIQLIASGEISGNLPAMLLDSAAEEELALDNYLERFLSLMEPLLIVVLGAIIMLIVLAILEPIFDLDDLID